MERTGLENGSAQGQRGEVVVQVHDPNRAVDFFHVAGHNLIAAGPQAAVALAAFLAEAVCTKHTRTVLL